MAAAESHPGKSPSAEFDMGRLWQGVRHSWRLIGYTALLFFVGAASLSFFQPYVYRAESSLVATNEDSGLGELAQMAENFVPGFLPSTGSTLNLHTEEFVVKSRRVLARVVEDLHLQIGVEELSGRQTLARQIGATALVLLRMRPEPVPEDLQAKPLPLTFSASVIPAAMDETEWRLVHTDATHYQVTNEEDGTLIGTGTLGEPFSHEGVSWTLDGIGGAIGDEYRLTLKTRERAVEDLLEDFMVRRPKDRADLMTVTVLHESPVMAKELANSIANAYLRQSLAWKSELAQELDTFLLDQITQTEVKLETAQDQLNAFRASSDTILLSRETEGLIDILTDTQLEEAQASMQVQSLQFAYDRLRSADTSSFLVILNGSSAEVPVQAAMIAELATLEADREGLLASKTAQHPEVLALTKQIDAKKQQILNLVREALSTARQNRDLIAGQVSELEAARSAIPETEKEFTALMSEVKLDTQLLTALKTKQQQNELTQAAQESPVRILDLAVAPQEHDRPKPALNLLFGLMLGLLFGVVLALRAELMDSSIRRRAQAETLGQPIVGLIPRIQEHRHSLMPSGTRLFLALRNDPAGPVAESFRMLRGASSLSPSGSTGRVLGITSPGVGEGKTLVTANLAAMYAQAGTATLLIDTDLRRPAIARSFGLPAGPGLSDVLEGRATLTDALRPSGIAHLTLLTAGSKVDHPSELLSGEAFQTLLQSLRREGKAGANRPHAQFEVVLLDLPPVAAVSETQVLGRLCSALYLLVRAGRTPLEVAADVLQRLEYARVGVRGLILNDVSKEDLGGKAAGYLYYDYTEEERAEGKGLWQRLTGKRAPVRETADLGDPRNN